MHLVDQKGNLGVFVGNYRRQAGSQLALRRFRCRIQAAAEGSLKVGQYAVENFGFAGHLDALRGKSERGNMCHRAIS